MIFEYRPAPEGPAPTRLGVRFALIRLAELRETAGLVSLSEDAPIRAAGWVPPPIGVEEGEEVDEDAEEEAELKELKNDDAREAAELAEEVVGESAALVGEDTGGLETTPSRVSLGVSKGLPSKPLMMPSKPSRSDPTKSLSNVRR